jgi:glycosyltransferase involved in cell wall biosynthesis
MKVCIIIPAYNEELNIKAVVDSLQNENNEWDIVIINDASLDKTAEKVRGLSGFRSTVSLIDLPVNLGIGGAVQTGFRFAREGGYDVAIQFDGDGQHVAGEIVKLLEPIKNSLCDVCIGSRFIGSNSGFRSTVMRRVGISIIMVAIKLITGKTITDCTSGFRAYNRKALSFLASDYPDDYPEPEAIVQLIKNGFTICETSVIMKERVGGRSSIYGLKSAYYMIKVILAIFVASLRQKTVQHG